MGIVIPSEICETQFDWVFITNQLKEMVKSGEICLKSGISLQKNIYSVIKADKAASKKEIIRMLRIVWIFIGQDCWIAHTKKFPLVG